MTAGRTYAALDHRTEPVDQLDDLLLITEQQRLNDASVIGGRLRGGYAQRHHDVELEIQTRIAARLVVR